MPALVETGIIGTDINFFQNAANASIKIFPKNRCYNVPAFAQLYNFLKSGLLKESQKH